MRVLYKIIFAIVVLASLGGLSAWLLLHEEQASPEPNSFGAPEKLIGGDASPDQPPASSKRDQPSIFAHPSFTAEGQATDAPSDQTKPALNLPPIPKVADFSLERRARAVYPTKLGELPVRLGNRIALLRVREHAGRLALESFVSWKDGEGKLIPGIPVEIRLERVNMFEAPFNSGAYTSERKLLVQNERELAPFPATTPTDAQGVALAELPVSSLETPFGLEVGVYRLHAQIAHYAIETPTINAMIDDPDLFELADASLPALERIAKLQAAIDQVNEPFYSSAMLYVLPDTIWLDSPEAFDQVADSIRRIEGNDPNAPQDPTRNMQRSRWLEQAGGELSERELSIRDWCDQARYAFEAKLNEYRDAQIKRLITIFESDLKYWNWKTSVLYGATLYQICENNRLPWEEPKLVQRAKELVGEDFTLNDLTTWRDYLTFMLKAAVQGAAYAQQPPGSYGPAWPEHLYSKMAEDISTFDPRDYLYQVATPSEDDPESTRLRWVPNDQAMAAFELEVREAMEIEKLLDLSTAKQSQGEPAKSESATPLPSRENAADAQSDFWLREEPDVLSHYRAFLEASSPWHTETCAGLKRVIEWTSFMPSAYRYTIHRQVLRKDVERVRPLFGPGWERAAITITTLAATVQRERTAIALSTLYPYQPLYGLFMSSEEGPYRHYAMDAEIDGLREGTRAEGMERNLLWKSERLPQPQMKTSKELLSEWKWEFSGLNAPWK